MRVNRRLQLRWLSDRLVLAVVPAILLFSGCQAPPFEHVPSASVGLNANHMPTESPQKTASTPSSTTNAVAGESSGSTPAASTGSNEALIVENLNLGHREAALNRLAQAEAYYRRVLELQPDNTVANHRLAVIAASGILNENPLL